MTFTINNLSGYPTVNLQPGSTGQNVTALQQWLVKNSFLTQAQMNTGVGIYGPATTQAVASLQAQLGVNAGASAGYYGPLTIAAIQSEITILATPSHPDLVINSLSLTTSSLLAGAGDAVNFSIGNPGNAASAATTATVNLYNSSGALIQQLGSIAIGSISANGGSSGTKILNVTVPSNLAPGNYSIGVTVAAVSGEVATNNNSFSTGLTILAAAPAVTAQTGAQSWKLGQVVNFTLSTNTFTDPQHQNLTYKATLASGAALPSWLTFNSATETFTGTVPNTAAGLNIKITATDTSGLSNSETFSVLIAAPAAPILATQTAAQTWKQGQALNLTLAANTFTDPQHENLTYTATLGSGAALPSWLTFNSATGTFAGTVPIGAAALSIKVTATDTGGASASETFSVATPAPTGPKVTGTVTGQADTDGASIHPFNAAVISGSTSTSSESVVVTLLDSAGHTTDANGSLSGAGLIKTGVGTYALSAGTPSAETTKLKALVFTPSAHEVTPGQTVATTMKLVDTEGSLSVTDSSTSVVATAVNDHPVITGTVAGQTTADTATINPFAHTTISSVDVGVQEAVTITLLDSSGHATDANGLLSGTGVSWVGAGTYHLTTGTPASVSAALDAVLFTPSEQVGTTVFQLSVSQGGAISTNSSTSVSVTAAAHSLASDVAVAEALIYAQVQDGSANANHLTGYSSLVDQIATDVAAKYATPQSNFTIGTSGNTNGSTSGFINVTSELKIPADSQFLDQCVALVQGLDHNVVLGTGSWKPGTAVDLNGVVQNIAPGTPIATFTGNAYNQQHAAIFLGSGVENNQAGFFVLDQYNTGTPQLYRDGTQLDVNHYEPAEVRFIPIVGTNADLHAIEYHVIA
jgi:hypothetical protein